jgi:hypothetical protein
LELAPPVRPVPQASLVLLKLAEPLVPQLPLEVLVPLAAERVAAQKPGAQAGWPASK